MAAATRRSSERERKSKDGGPGVHDRLLCLDLESSSSPCTQTTWTLSPFSRWMARGRLAQGATDEALVLLMRPRPETPGRVESRSRPRRTAKKTSRHTMPTMHIGAPNSHI